VVENELHHLEQVVPEHIGIGLADRRELDVIDRLGLASPVLRQCDQLDRLHLLEDTFEPI